MNLMPVTLAGRIVRLEPPDYTHSEDLLNAAAYDEIRTYLDEPTPRAEADITGPLKLTGILPRSGDFE